jgi:hypothetical protein
MVWVRDGWRGVGLEMEMMASKQWRAVFGIVVQGLASRIIAARKPLQNAGQSPCVHRGGLLHSSFDFRHRRFLAR